MTIIVDSYEYRCWHEVGHATACLHFGGEVDFIEMLFNDPRGHGRTRCDERPGTERLVACAGFAAEFYLLDKGLAAKAVDDDRDISQIVFHNAVHDRADFWDRPLPPDLMFSEDEDRAFMNHALEHVVPVVARYFTGMQSLVRVLGNERLVVGRQVRALLLPHS
jgi:hypothetical protein